MRDEFQAAQEVAITGIVEEKQRDTKDNFSTLRTRVEDLENSKLVLEEVIKELTPTDDLETVKMRLNQVISIINKLAV